MTLFGMHFVKFWLVQFGGAFNPEDKVWDERHINVGIICHPQGEMFLVFKLRNVRHTIYPINDTVWHSFGCFNCRINWLHRKRYPHAHVATMREMKRLFLKEIEVMLLCSVHHSHGFREPCWCTRFCWHRWKQLGRYCLRWLWIRQREMKVFFSN